MNQKVERILRKYKSKREVGVEEFSLNLDRIYRGEEEKRLFDIRWRSFFESDRYNSLVFKRIGNNLEYLSESWIPTKKDNRPPLLLLFGNPAPHSVVSRMYFAYEGKGKEHRVWRIFREVGLLEFEGLNLVSNGSLFGGSESIKKRFYDLDYKSPFRLAMVVYFSMPSPPSEPKWSGVGGLHKLFGEKALRIIEREEQKRIKRIISSFLPKKGRIITFQKDAYNGVKEINSPAYSLNLALEGKLKSRCRFNKKVEVIGVPPTRFLQGQKAKLVLKNAIKGI